jgi:large subunit ribosomal protein L1
MSHRSKRYKKALDSLDLTKAYSLEEALQALYTVPTTKFDETLEMAFRLGVDPKQSDQMIRGTVHLPHGSGKRVRVIVFTESPSAALDAGAELAGLEDLLVKIEGGWADFDVAIATTTAMKEVRRVSRILGPRGLMPNPKSGTVVELTAVTEAIQAVKAGRVEFKMDKTANLSVAFGKRSFDLPKVIENAKAVLQVITKMTPPSFKGRRYILNVSLSSTMSPALKLDKTLL